MPSAVELSNLALLRVGVSTTIDDLEEPTKEARVCRAFYAPTVRLVLEDFDWPFARRRVQLAEVAGDVPLPWSFQYRYPAECLALRALEAGTRIVRAADRVTYEIASDATGRLVLTDIAPAAAVYTHDVTDPSQFPPGFADVVAWRLAHEIAMPLAVAPQLRQDAWRYYQQARVQAMASALNEPEDGPPPDSDLIRVRA